MPELIGQQAARPGAAQRRRPDLRQGPTRRPLARDPGREHRPLHRVTPPGTVVGRGLGHDARRRDARRATGSTWCCAESESRPTCSPSGRSSPGPVRPSRVYTAPENRDGSRRPLGGGPARARPRRRAGQRPAARVRPWSGQAARDDETPQPARPGCSTAAATLDGLTVDTDLRWELLLGLAREGRVDDAGSRRRARPRQHDLGPGVGRRGSRRDADAEAKAHAWREAVESDDVAERDDAQHRAQLQPARSGRRAARLPAQVPRDGRHIWEDRGVHVASTILGYMFPTAIATQETLDAIDAWLSTQPGQPGGAAARLRGPRRRRPGAGRPGPRRRGLSSAG